MVSHNISVILFTTLYNVSEPILAIIQFFTPKLPAQNIDFETHNHYIKTNYLLLLERKFSFDLYSYFSVFLLQVYSILDWSILPKRKCLIWSMKRVLEVCSTYRALIETIATDLAALQLLFVNFTFQITIVNDMPFIIQSKSPISCWQTHYHLRHLLYG